MVDSSSQKYKNPPQVLNNTNKTTYDELLSTDNGLSSNQRHLHFLVTEVFRPVTNLKPKFLVRLF